MEQIPAGINAVFICPPGNEELWRATVRMIDETLGVRPAMKRISESAARAIYAPATSKIIVNMASSAMHSLLGCMSVALTLDVEDPVSAAKKAVAIYRDLGCAPIMETHAEPEFPDGFVVFVAVPELEGIVLLFRPANPDPEVLAQIPKAEPWTDDDFGVG